MSIRQNPQTTRLPDFGNLGVMLRSLLAVNLLRVNRILVIAHTKCAMASGDDEVIRQRVAAASGLDVSELAVGANADQEGQLRRGVQMLLDHPLIAGRAQVGGFVYDVDSGLLSQVV